MMSERCLSRSPGDYLRHIVPVALPVLLAALFAPPLVAQQPGPDGPRQRLLMDYGWQFSRGESDGAEAPGFDDAGWRTLDLPHDWSIEGPYDQAAATTGRGGYLPTGIGWYRRTFQLPEGAAGQQVSVTFDGVYQNSDVWINGHHLGHRPFGYIGFSYDLTPYLEEGDNVLAVRVDNSRQPNSRWYSGSGIYRHVWLNTTHTLHLAQWGTHVTTPTSTADEMAVDAHVRVRSAIAVGNGDGAAPGARPGAGSAAGTAGMIRTEVLSPDGAVVAEHDTTWMAEGDTVHLDRMLAVPSPELWSPETPELYTLRETVLSEGGTVLDQVDSPFGIRHIEFTAEEGFLLNGQPVKMRGVNLHHGAGPVGAAVPEDVWRRRFHLLKEMGVNAIRTAHNPMAPEFMAMADSMGFLVMDEVFDEWTHAKVEYGYNQYFHEWAERDLRAFIRQERNHPAVVIWSLGNEIGEQHTEGGHAILAMLKGWAMQEDDTRPYTSGNDHIYADDGATTEEFMSLLDVVGYNYVDRWHERRELYNLQDKLDHPDWRFIGTESGAVWGSRGEYFAGGDPDRFRPGWATGMIRAENLWKFVSLNDHFAGDFMWTGIDYLGESRWPRKNSTSGQMDLVGFPDDGYFFYQSRWTDEPMLHLFPHWNWEGREGQFLPVLAYTNVDAVELYLNGRFIGEKRMEFPRQGNSGSWNGYDEPLVFPTTSDLHLTWDVPYEPGVLRAVGRRDGEVVITREVRTAGAPASLRVTVDREAMFAGERNVAHVVVEVVDTDGNVVPDADNLVRFQVSGAGGEFLAVGNGDPAEYASYQIPERRAHHGKLLAMIQSTDRTGTVRVTASTEGMDPVTVQVRVVAGDPLPRVR